MVGKLLEAGNGVHTKEVLVGLLVGQIKLADVGLGQNGLEDVVLVWVTDNVLEHLVGVTEPAQLVVVSLEVAVHQQGVNANTNAMLADERYLVLHLVLNHLKGSKTEKQERTEEVRVNKKKVKIGRQFELRIFRSRAWLKSSSREISSFMKSSRLVSAA